MSGETTASERRNVSDLVIPEGAEWFQVQKRVRKKTADGKDKDGWTALLVEVTPGTRSTRIPAVPEVFADGGGQLRAEMFQRWGAGLYRLRFSTNTTSPHFELSDPATSAPPSPSFGGSVPRAPAVNAETGRPEIATPAQAMALLPPSVQRFMAMQTAMAAIQAPHMQQQQESQRQMTELFTGLVTALTGRPLPAAGGAESAELQTLRLENAMLKAVQPLERKIAQLTAKVNELEGGEDDPDDIDWEKPIGEILGVEVKKAIVEVAGEITPEMLPFLKQALPAAIKSVGAKIAAGMAKEEAAKAAIANGAS